MTRREEGIQVEQSSRQGKKSADADEEEERDWVRPEQAAGFDGKAQEEQGP